jgi:carbon monoxide dehydrogenase subunit G
VICWRYGLCLLLCLPLAAMAVDERQLEVSREGRVYHVVVDALIDAPPQRVKAQLLDISKLTLLNPSVTAARATEVAGGMRVESELEECLFGFCRRLLHVQQVETHGDEITAQTLAEPGASFSSGKAHWRLSPEGTGTRLEFSAETEPNLWLPPVIGPMALMRQLREKTRDSLLTLERLSRE